MVGIVTKGRAMYAQLPSYRAMFDREGVEGPGELALVENEEQVRAKLEELADAGIRHSEFAPGFQFQYGLEQSPLETYLHFEGAGLTPPPFIGKALECRVDRRTFFDRI